MPDRHWSQRAVRFVNRFEDVLLVTLLAVMVTVAGAQIVLRNLFDTGVSWADPLLRVLVLWVGLLGAMVATQRYRHIAIDVALRYLPPHWRPAAQCAMDLFTATVAAIVSYYGGAFVVDDHAADTLAFDGVPAWACELIIPVAFGAIAMRYLGFAWVHGRQFVRGKTS
jgi:TRAP-type C4-dicarboxylate transport system permease small subunit